MTDRGDRPRVPDLEFPKTLGTKQGETLARFPEAQAIAAEVIAAAEAAQHGGNRSPEGSDRPEPGHDRAMDSARQRLHPPGFGRASDEDWRNVGKYE